MLLTTLPAAALAQRAPHAPQPTIKLTTVDYDGDGIQDNAIVITRRTAEGVRRLVRVYSGADSRLLRTTDRLVQPDTDFDKNGVTDAADLSLLLTTLGPADQAPAAYDLNGDGAVNMADTQILIDRLGQPAPPSQTAAGGCGGVIGCGPLCSTTCPPCSCIRGPGPGSGPGTGGTGAGGPGADGAGTTFGADGLGLGGAGGGPTSGGGGTTNNNPPCTAGSETMTVMKDIPEWTTFKTALETAADATPFINSLSLDVAGQVSVTSSKTCCPSSPNPPTSPVTKLTYGTGNMPVTVSIGGQFGLPGFTYNFQAGFNVTVPDPRPGHTGPIAEISAMGMIQIGPQLTVPAPGGPPLTISVGVNGTYLPFFTCPQEECLTITGNAALSARVTIGGSENFHVEVVFPGLLQDCPIGTQFSATLEGFIDTGASINASYNVGCTDASGNPNSGFQGGAIDFDGVHFGIHGSAKVHLVNQFTIEFDLPSPYNVDPQHWTLNP